MLRRVVFQTRTRPSLLLSPLRAPSRVPMLGCRVGPMVSRRSYVELSDVPARIVGYDDVSKWAKTPGDVTIVDVREPEEFAEGHIPGAVNIPFKSSPGALGLEPTEFEDTFEVAKPPTHKPVLFYCQGGVRSSAAEQLASAYGYKNRLNYKGSYADWLAHTEEKKETPEHKTH